MSILDKLDIKAFESHKNNFKVHIKSNDKSYDDINLNNLSNTLLKDRNIQNTKSLEDINLFNPSIHLYKNILSQSVMRSFDTNTVSILQKHLGYSKNYNDLTVSIYDTDTNVVKAIAAVTKKRKLKGSTNLVIPYKIASSKIVFIAIQNQTKG